MTTTTAPATTPSAAPTSPAIAAVNRFYDAYGREDVAGMRVCIHPECRWMIPGHHPLSGTKVGRDEVVVYFDLLRQGNFKAEIIYLTGDDVHAIDVHRGWGEAKGAKCDTNWVLYYTVEDGLIREVQNFCYDQHQADLCYWAVWQLKPLPDRVA